MPDSTRNSSARCHFVRYDDKRPIVFEGENEDRFVESPARALRACMKQQVEEEAKDKADRTFEVVIGKIIDWCQIQPTVVQAVLGSHGAGSMLVIVTEGSEFDFTLSDSVTDLELSLHELCPGIRLDVLTLPEGVQCGPEVYVDPSAAVELYARSQDSASERTAGAR